MPITVISNLLANNSFYDLTDIRCKTDRLIVISSYLLPAPLYIGTTSIIKYKLYI